MSGGVSQAKVFGALVASFPLAYVVWQTQVHLLGHPSPETGSQQWQAKTRLLNLSKEREGDPEQPILLNPFRTGVPATVKSKEDLPNLEDEE